MKEIDICNINICKVFQNTKTAYHNKTKYTMDPRIHVLMKTNKYYTEKYQRQPN